MTPADREWARLYWEAHNGPLTARQERALALFGQVAPRPAEPQQFAA